MSTTAATALHLGIAGIEDRNTILEPEISFWRSEKPRHTHFVVDYQILEHPSPTWGTTLSFTLDKNFDLLRRSTLVVKLPKLTTNGTTQAAARFTDDIGRAMWERIELVSGNTTINTLYPELEHCLEELQKDPANQWAQLTGKCDTVAELVERAKGVQWIWCPLEFYFSKVDGDALPLVNLVGSSLVVKVYLRAFDKVVVSTAPPTLHDAVVGYNQPVKVYLYNEVIMLNDDERAVFSRSDMTYVYQNYDRQVTSIAYSASKAASQDTIDLQMNHPIGDLIVLFRDVAKNADATIATASLSDRAYFDFSGWSTEVPYVGEAFDSMQLKLNQAGYWSADLASPHFFRKYLPLTRYGRVPRKHIYTIPFALYPASEKPTGELNMSKIDSRKLLIKWPLTGSQPTGGTEVIIFSRHFNEFELKSNSIQVSFA
jgi:hypothetical protein